MRITTFGTFVLAVTMMTAGPALAQSANRTSAPAAKVTRSAALAVEAPDVTKCRVHCQNLPQLGVGHTVRTVSEAGARNTECAKKMVVR